MVSEGSEPEDFDNPDVSPSESDDKIAKIG